MNAHRRIARRARTLAATSLAIVSIATASIALVSVAASTIASRAWAHDGVDHRATPSSARAVTTQNRHREHFTDLPLLDQHGRSLRFYDDVLKGRTVLISFVFTSCQHACPVLVRTLGEVQDALDDDLARKVTIVSISVDPRTDTPAVLSAYAERVGADPGWVFLTGKPENVDWVIYKLGQYHPDFNAHSPLILAGNVDAGRWRAFPGFARPDELVAALRGLAQR